MYLHLHPFSPFTHPPAPPYLQSAAHQPNPNAVVLVEPADNTVTAEIRDKRTAITISLGRGVDLPDDIDLSPNTLKQVDPALGREMYSFF